MKNMTLDRIYPAINEAFKAGNKARKKEFATDTIQSVDSVQAQINLFKKQTNIELEIKDGKPYFDGDLYINNCTSLTSLPDNLTVDGDLSLEGCTGLILLPVCLTVEGNLWLKGCTGLKFFPDDLWVNGNHIYDIPKSLRPFIKKLGIEFEDNDIWAKDWMEKCFSQYPNDWVKQHFKKSIKEAFRAGNRARKKETVQDAVSDITDVHDISADELEQALSVPDLRHRFPDVLTEVIGKHSLPVQLVVGVSQYSYVLRRNDEQVCIFYWHSGGTTMRLYMQPENKTISGCMLYLEMKGKGKLYRTSLERLRLVLLGLDGDDLEEAFKAGNRARKRETVQDTVDGVDMTAATITAALAKLEPVHRFDQESVEIMLAEFKPDRLTLTSFKDGEGAHAPRAFSIFDLRGSGPRIPCYIRPRGRKLWLTFNPADIMNSEDFIIAEADRQGKVEFGPGVQKLADILDDNYTLENN